MWVPDIKPQWNCSNSNKQASNVRGRDDKKEKERAEKKQALRSANPPEKKAQVETGESDDDCPLASLWLQNAAERREQQKLLQQASMSKQVDDQLSAEVSAAVTSHLSRGTEQGEETLGEELVDRVEATPRDVPRSEELEGGSASHSRSVLRVSRDTFGQRKPSSTYHLLTFPALVEVSRVQHSKL